jgi:hypothetical protein
MPDLPLDVLSDVSEGLKAISILCEDWGQSPHFPAYGIGVLCRLLGRSVECAVSHMPESAT